MKSLFILLVFIFLYSASFAQKDYRKFRESLPGLTCGVDTLSIETHLYTIDQLNAHIKTHPDHHGAYYDLGMEYYTVAAKVDSKDSEYWQQSIQAFEKYIEHSPGKQKFKGYKNLAVIHGFLGNCDKALLNIALVKSESPNKFKDNTNEDTEAWIRKKCQADEG